MDLEHFGRTQATLDEIRRRVMFALDRHPLCRGIEFDVVSMPRNRKNNWTVTLQAVEPDALWEAPISLPTSRKPMNWLRRPDSGPFPGDVPIFSTGSGLRPAS
jgi:hypothetical protein